MADLALFPRLLGADYTVLPAALRAVHDSEGTTLLAGRSEIERRPGLLSWLICAVMGLPEAGRGVAVHVECIRQDESELWKRQFGNRRYQSILAPGPEAGEMIEHFGPFKFIFALAAEPHRLTLDLRRARFLGIPLPKMLCPRCFAEEREENGRFVFDIPLDMPLLGRVLHYKGWLVMEPDRGRRSSAG